MRDGIERVSERFRFTHFRDFLRELNESFSPRFASNVIGRDAYQDPDAALSPLVIAQTQPLAELFNILRDQTKPLQVARQPFFD